MPRRLHGMAPALWSGLLAALAAALIGSGWQILSRHGVTTTLGPIELATLRYGVPALALLPLWWKSGLRPAGLQRRAVLLMVLGGGLPFGLVVLAGAALAPAAHIGVFMGGGVPLFTALGAWLVHGERIGRWRLAGLGLVLLGIALFAAGTGRVDAGVWRGDLLFVLAAALWAAYTLVFRRSGLGAWQGTALVNAWSALLLVPLLVLGGAPRLWSAPAADVAVQVAGQGVLAGLLGLATFLAAVNRLGASRAALSAALVPLLTTLGAAWLLAEPLTAAVLLSVGLVMAGVALAALN